MITRSVWREHDHCAAKQVSKNAARATRQRTAFTSLSVSTLEFQKKVEGEEMLGDRLCVRNSLGDSHGEWKRKFHLAAMMKGNSEQVSGAAGNRSTAFIMPTYYMGTYWRVHHCLVYLEPWKGYF